MEDFEKLIIILNKKNSNLKNLNEILIILEKYFLDINLENIYLNFSLFCTKTLYNFIKINEDFSLKENRIINYGVSCIINWGIYPHLPKSIQIEFLDDYHWVYLPSNPRLYRPDSIFLEFLIFFFNNTSCEKFFSNFLQHTISIFYYLLPEKIPSILELQKTDLIFTTYLILINKKINISYLIPKLIIERSDSLESIESTIFPNDLCARAISLPPNKDNEEEYYNLLFPKLIQSIRTNKGHLLSKLILSNIITIKPNFFFQFLNLNSLIDWPNKESIGNVIFLLNLSLSSKDLTKILIPPIPFRLLFLSIFLNGEILEICLKLLKIYLDNIYNCIDFLKIILNDLTLSSINLDGFSIEINDHGIFIINKDNENEFEILEKMRNLLNNLINIKNLKNIILELPPTIGSIQFLSSILPLIPIIDSELSFSILTFLSNFNNNDIDVLSIAKFIIEKSSKLLNISEKILNKFGNDIPELKILKLIENNNKNNEENFDIKLLIDDLNSNIPIYNARGIFLLRNNLMKKNHPLRNEEIIEKILLILNKKLSNTDSYIYLNTIKAYESMADIFPHLIIEKITSLFPNKDINTSLIINQILMLCIKRTGPGLIHSKNGNLCGFFIKAFIRGIEHESTLIQASSLSNLATFIETLEYGIFLWLTDIILVIINSWQNHKVIDIRRAASYLCIILIKTIGKGFSETSKEDIKILINFIKKNKESELDDVCHSNADLCYDLIWEIAPKLLY